MEDKQEQVWVRFFSTKRSDFLTSHRNGLDAEQVKMLQSLKVGDRLKIYVNPEVEGKSRLSMGKMIEVPASL